MRFSELQEALDLLGISGAQRGEQVKRAYRRRGKGISESELGPYIEAYRKVMLFCESYPFSFTKEEFFKAFPQERLRRFMRNHPLWQEGEEED